MKTPIRFAPWAALLAMPAASFAGTSGATLANPLQGAVPMSSESLYGLATKTLEGKDVSLGDYKGKVALVVNVASECGYTPQYAGLEKLYEELKDKNFVILGFPSNDFGGQEPGTPDQIRTFCTKNYSVTFPLFEKLVTKAGENQSPIYRNLAAQTGELPTWNFCKYLVGKEGRVIKYFKNKVKPEDPAFRADVLSALQ
jgi:glutathione peroxidase